MGFMGQKTQPTVSKHWRKRSPKDQASIPLGPPHCADKLRRVPGVGLQFDTTAQGFLSVNCSSCILTVDVLLHGEVVHGHVVRNGRRVLKDGGVDVLDKRRTGLVEDHDRHPSLLRHEDEVLHTSINRTIVHSRLRPRGRAASHRPRWALNRIYLGAKFGRNRCSFGLKYQTV